MGAVVGCAQRSDSVPTRPTISQLDGARYVWREARCVDGALPLAHLGFERELRTEVHGRRVLMVFDTRLARDDCRELLAWDALYDEEVQYWDFWAPARIVRPVDVACGVMDLGEHGGTLEVDGDELAVTTFRSPWCRGFDASFVYQRVAPRALDERDLLERYVLHFNRRDRAGLTQLFSPQATLLEPFSKTDDGSMQRHVGRRAVLAWHERAFAGSGWSAMRLTDLRRGGDGTTWIADWDYMDSELAEPIRGRTLFVMADRQIFLIELQLVTSPQPRPPRSGADAGVPSDAAAAESW